MREPSARLLSELVAGQPKRDITTAQVKQIPATGSTLMELPGVGAVVAASALADTGHVARFTDRNQYASWTGSAPIEAFSGRSWGTGSPGTGTGG